MPTYVIGDIQGCWSELQRLLERIEYCAERDRLWLVGDLVNRGGEGLQVLRWARANERRVTTVLGNHDLHLLARWLGVEAPRPRDTLRHILDAPDCDALCEWLRRRPLLHREGDTLLVHAGLLPQWTAVEAEALARTLESRLRSASAGDLLAQRHLEAPAHWEAPLEEEDRLRLALSAFATLRMVDAGGRMEPTYNGAPDAAPPGLHPWFEAPERRHASQTIVFGHWAALGVHLTERVLALDSGCVWGGRLSALRLEDRVLFSVSAERDVRGERRP